MSTDKPPRSLSELKALAWEASETTSLLPTHLAVKLIMEAYRRGDREGRMAACGLLRCGVCLKCEEWAKGLP